MIKSISIDAWNGTTFKEEVIVNPTWTDTLSFLRKLDGDKFTLVFFEVSDTDSALVGGDLNISLCLLQLMILYILL